MRRHLAALAASALLLAGCSDVDTGPEKPTFGGGSSAGADAGTDDVSAAVREAGIRPCTDLPLADAPAEGDDALPSLRLACLGGEGSVDLARLRGPAVVNLWASWCKPCREELPLLARLDERAGDRLTVVGIDVQDAAPEAAVELARGAGVTYPQLSDPDVATRAPLRVVGLPQTLFVDAQGRMVATERVPFTSYDDLTAAVRRHLEVTP
jgi:thiol-disulfide isomerase/thioredoxin